MLYKNKLVIIGIIYVFFSIFLHPFPKFIIAKESYAYIIPWQGDQTTTNESAIPNTGSTVRTESNTFSFNYTTAQDHFSFDFDLRTQNKQSPNVYFNLNTRQILSKPFAIDFKTDSDNDGVIDKADKFPFDPAASLDEDNDGFPDQWNENATEEQIQNSTLILDPDPNTPACILLATHAQTGNILNQTTSFSAPLLANFNVTGLPATHYKWDFDNDNRIDRITYDHSVQYYFEHEGVQTVNVIAVSFDGLECKNSVSFTLQPSPIINRSITFVPFYPTSDQTSSEIMVGGKAIRWYQILDDQHVPFSNTKLYYTYDQATQCYETESDVNGFIKIETPITQENTRYDLIVLQQNNAPISFECKNSPSFIVHVTDRKFKEKYTFLFGASIGVDIGAGASLGPIKLKLLSLGVYGGINVSSVLGFDTIGDQTDLIIGSSCGIEVDADLSPKFLQKSWQKIMNKPELSFGPKLKGQLKHTLASTYCIPDFFNESDENYHKKMLIAAVIFIDSLLSAKSTNVVTDGIILAILKKILDVDDDYKKSNSSEICAKGKASAGLNFELTNPLGSISGSKVGIDLSLFNSEYLYELTNEKDVSGTVKITQNIYGEMRAAELDIQLAKKFGRDNRRKDTPIFNVSQSSFHAFTIEGEKRVSVEHKPDGQKTIALEQLQYRHYIDQGVFTDTIEESYLSFSVDTPSIIDEISQNSRLYSDMLSGKNHSVFPESYNQAFDAVKSIRQGSIQWEEKKLEIKDTEIPFDLGFGAGLSFGFKLNINVLSVLEYMSKNGILSSDKGYLQTSVYHKDEWITNRVKTPEAVVNQYYQVLEGVITDIIETFKKKVEAAKESIVYTSKAIAEGGAKLIAEQDSFLEKYSIYLSQLIPNKRTYRIRASRTKTSETYLASTIGNVYIVNVQDENGHNLKQFQKSLELTIGFTMDLLKNAGFSSEHASQLNIYRWDGELECYRFLGGAVDLANQSVTCLIQLPGQYILAIDLTPPDISNFSLSDHTPTPALTFSVKDNLSGIDISTIVFEIDDVAYVTAHNYTNYFNPEAGYFTYQIIDPLEKGVHTITMIAGDTSGNIQQQSYTFTVNDIPPFINEDVFIHSLSSNEPAVITAHVTDDETITGVFLYYRAKANEMNYLACEMVESDAGIYTANIPQKYCTGFGIRYYIKAIDESGNETVSSVSDIDITDDTGPKLTGNIHISNSSDQLFIQWNKALDMDLSGYYVYLGHDMDHLELYKDTARTNYLYLESVESESYIAIRAYDQSGNIGNQIVKVMRTFDFHLNQGWNLISLPVTPSNTALSHLFPDYEAAYEYKNGAYLSVNNIVPGKGYWLKVPSEKGYSISGQPFSSWTIDSVNGWHLVGSPHNGVSPDDMSVRVIFRYLNGAYEQVFTLLPGFGYWVKISE